MKGAAHALRDRQRLHRRQRQGVRRGVPGRLHLRGRAQELHQPQGVHRLRRLRAGLPGRGDQPGPPRRRRRRAVRRGQPRLLHRGAPRPRRAARRARRRQQGRRARHRHPARPGAGPDARRPPPGRRPRARPRARVARPGLDRLGARLRPRRDPRGALGRRRAPGAGPARRALRGAGRRRGAAVLRVQPEGHRLPALRRPAADRRAQPGPVPAGRQRQPAPALPDRRRGRAPARPRRRGPQAAPRARRLPLRRPGALPGLPGARRARRAAGRALRHQQLPGLDERARRPRVPPAGRARLPRRSTSCWRTAAAAGGTTPRRSWRWPTRHVWIELSGLPPKRLPEYYARFDLGRLAQKWIFATDWPGVPGTAQNARAVAGLGLDEQTVARVLGGNARQVYAGLGHLDPPQGAPS